MNEFGMLRTHQIKSNNSRAGLTERVTGERDGDCPSMEYAGGPGCGEGRGGVESWQLVVFVVLFSR